MRPAGTDAIGAFRWGLRHYAVIFVLCLAAGAVFAPYWALHRKPPLDATAFVIAQRLDMNLSALPRYGEAVFGNGSVASAVAAKFGDLGADKNVINDRVSLVAEQDSIVFEVVGHDADPKKAADIANTAATAFVTALNVPGVGVGAFEIQHPADPPAGRGGVLGTVVATAIGTAAGIVLGLAAVSFLLVIRRPVIADADVVEATGVQSLGTVTVPRTWRGRVARPAEFAGLVPVCRRLLALPTPTVVLVSRPRQERLRRKVSAALATVLGRVRDVRYVGSEDARRAIETVTAAEAPVGTGDGNGNGTGTGASAGRQRRRPSGRQRLTVIDSSEPMDLVQPPHLTATVLVVKRGISGAALRAAVVEHLGGSAESRVLLVRRGRPARSVYRPERVAAEDHRQPEPVDAS
jgi:capsular polysaccharide biosynthesis protein